MTTNAYMQELTSPDLDYLTVIEFLNLLAKYGGAIDGIMLDVVTIYFTTQIESEQFMIEYSDAVKMSKAW